MNEIQIEQIKENLTKLINHNGGWVVLCHREPQPLNVPNSFFGIQFTPITEATMEEAKEDAKFLGLPEVTIAGLYFYKCIFD